MSEKIRDVTRRHGMLCHCYGQKPPSEHPIGYRLVSKRGFHLQIFCKYKRPIKVTDDAEIDTDIRLYPAYWEFTAREIEK